MNVLILLALTATDSVQPPTQLLDEVVIVSQVSSNDTPWVVCMGANRE